MNLAARAPALLPLAALAWRTLAWGALAWGALALGMAGASPAPSGDAQRAYAAGRFEEARQLWASLADAGDAQAQLGLGVLYDVGQGVRRDAAAAYGWYRRAAEAGLAEAQFNVAVMHDSGEGVPRDAAQAALWYARAAAHGNRRAQYNLGQLYEAGQGLPRNVDQAEVWYARAATDLPAAADKLAALRRNRPLRALGRPGEAGALVPAKADTPADGGSIARSNGPAAVELAWTAPAQATPVQFFVQLLALDPDGAQEVFSAYTDESVALAPLERVPGRYAWRVYTVDRDARHYAAGGWNLFSAGPSR